MTMPPSPAPQTPYQPSAPPPPAGLVLTGIDVPFLQLVAFFFKAMLAALPAFIAAMVVIKLLFGLVFFGFDAWRFGGWGPV